MESRGRSRSRTRSRSRPHKKSKHVPSTPRKRLNVRSKSKSRSRSRGRSRTRSRSRSVAQIVKEQVATHDQYSFNKGIIWDSNQAQQSLVLNTNGQLLIQNVLNNPADIALVIAYLRGFFANCQKFEVLEAICHLDIVSRSQAAQWLEVYEFDCIRDLPVTADWTNFQTFYNYGLTNTGGTITAGGIQPGHTPFQNPLWCQYFHCKRVRRLQFNPFGANGKMQARLTWKHKNAKFDYLRDGKFIEHLAYKGKTKTIIPVIRGAIGHDSVAPFTQIDYDAGGYTCVYTWSYKTAFFEEAAHDSTFVNNLAQPTTAYRELVNNTIVAGVNPVVG